MPAGSLVLENLSAGLIYWVAEGSLAGNLWVGVWSISG
jgi:hypothetical protein